MFYWFCWLVMRGFFWLFGSLKIDGLEHVPRRGPVILAPNHIHGFDPPLVGICVPRRCAFMAKEELFRHRLLGALLRALGAFPVRRGTPDRVALRRAMAVLEQGGALVLFPEGTRSPDGRLQPAELGIGLIALRTGAPIVPVRISGTRELLPPGARFPRRSQVRVRFGAPLVIASPGDRGGRDAYQAVADRVMAAIAALEPSP